MANISEFGAIDTHEPLEIERKWIVDRATACTLEREEENYESGSVIQIYMTPLESDTEIRYKKTLIHDDLGGVVRYQHTTKKGHGLTRTEVEDDITKEVFYDKTNNPDEVDSAIKYDFINFENGLELAYVPALEIFIIEKEFDSEEAANAYIPTFEGKEITGQINNHKIAVLISAMPGRN